MKHLSAIVLSTALGVTLFTGCSEEQNGDKKTQGKSNINIEQREQGGERREHGERSERGAREERGERGERGERNVKGQQRVDPVIAKEMRALALAYRENNTEENKAKIVELLTKSYDQRIVAQKQEIEELKTQLTELEESLKNSNKEETIANDFERLINNIDNNQEGARGERRERGERSGEKDERGANNNR